ncbi:MAG: hypothetical protein U0359_15370 [Byssovorax sp.]
MRAILLMTLLPLSAACGGVTTAPPGNDAGPDAAKAPFCADLSPKPLFCDDFDASTDLTAWTTSGAEGGTLAVQPGDATSAPNAMRASIQPGTASAYATVALAQAGLTHARLAFAVRLDPACFTGTDINNGLVGLGTVVFGAGADAYSLSLFAGNGSSLVFEGGGAAADAGPGGQYLPAAQIPSGAWARVDMDVDLGTGKKVRTRVDGGEPQESALAYAPDMLGAPLVSVGLDAAVSHPTACVAHFDDVVFDGGS